MGFSSLQDGDARDGPRRPRDPLTGEAPVVLVVDDQAPLREMVAACLRDAGYRVLQASSAREALVISARPEVRLDLVLTDLVMPGMSGAILAQRLRSIRPGLPLLYTSAYPMGTFPDLFSDLVASPALTKPFKCDELIAAVRSSLEGAS